MSQQRSGVGAVCWSRRDRKRIPPASPRSPCRYSSSPRSPPCCSWPVRCSIWITPPSATLIPVIIAATRWGATPAIVSGLAGLAASAFFFYPPIYDIRVANPAHVADLILFVVVAVVTGQLANRVREHVKAARQREEETKALYFFSRRLAVASSPADIHAAIQDHLSTTTGCRIVLFAAGAGQPHPETSPQWSRVPSTVQRAVLDIFDNAGEGREAPLIDRRRGRAG